MEDKSKAGKNSFIVMIFTLISRLLGIVRIRILASVFGASATADAINFSFNIPNNFRKLFSEGALSSAIVPEFSGMLEDKQRTQKLFSSFLTIQVIISFVILLLTIFLREPIVLFLSDFSNPEQNALAIGLLPYFALFLVFILLSAYFSSVLQSKSSFLVQSIAPLFFSIAVITSLVLFTDVLGPYSMALGAASGGLLQMLTTSICLMTKGFRFTLDFDFQSEDFRRVVSKWIPAMGSSAIAIISTQAAFYFASGLGEGSVSAFSNSLIFWQTPYGIFFNSVSTVFLPILSRSKGRELSDNFKNALQRLTNFLLPCAIFLIFFRNDVVSVVLRTGKLTLENSLLTSKILGVYLVGMLLVAWYGLLQKLCFCLSKQKLVMQTSAIIGVLDILLTFFLIKSGMQVVSLAIANTISNFTGCIILYFGCVNRQLVEFDAKGLVKHILKVIIVCLPMIVYCIVLKSLNLDYWESGSSLMNLLIFAGISSGGVSLVLIMDKIMKIKIF